MFDFLTNIYDKAKSALSSVFQPSSNVAGVGASHPMDFRVGVGLDPVQTQVAKNTISGTQAPQMSVAPNMSTILGPATGNQNGSITYNTAQGAVSIPKNSLPANQTPYYPANPGLLSPSLTVKPNTTVAASTLPTKSVVRQAQTPTVSTSAPISSGGGGYNSDWFTASGIPLSSKNGAPIHGELGTSGTGSFSSQNGGMPSFSPSTNTPGTSGFGGFSIGSSPLGYFNAQSSGVGDTSQQTDQQLASKLKYNPATGRLEPSLNPDGTPTFNQADVNALGKTSPIPVINPTGGKTIQNQGTATQPRISDRLTNTIPERPLGNVSVPNIMSSTDLQKAISDTQAYLNAPGAKSPADLQQLQNHFKQILDVGVENYLKQKGMTPDTNVVEDSPELQNFFNNLSGNDKFNYQQFADDFRTQSGMSSYLKLKESAIAAIDVATQEFNKFVKDVRDNPDLPSGLATKRMSAFKDQIYSPAIEQAKAMLDKASNAIDDINGALKSKLGIVEAQRSDDQRIKQNNLEVFKTLVKAGADFTQEEKNSWAQKLGLSSGALNSLTKKLSTADTYITTDNGVTKAIDKVTGKTVWQNGTATKSNEPQNITKITAIANQFDNEAIVKNYNVIKEGKQFVDNISSDTQNPADQQGLIYAFAKAMDPNSVVREGEYATVQKYAQSWASTFGFNAERIFSNSPFLSKEAIENMKKTIDAKASASEQNYKNVYEEYGRRINLIGGVSNGKDYITDYSSGYSNNQNIKQPPQNDSAIFNSVVSGTGTTGNNQGGGFTQFLGDLWKNITGG